MEIWKKRVAFSMKQYSKKHENLTFLGVWYFSNEKMSVMLQTNEEDDFPFFEPFLRHYYSPFVYSMNSSILCSPTKKYYLFLPILYQDKSIGVIIVGANSQKNDGGKFFSKDLFNRFEKDISEMIYKGNDLFKKIQEILVENLDKNMDIDEISELLSAQPFEIENEIQNNTGKSFTKYFRDLKMLKAKEFLSNKEPVAQVAEKTGYWSESSFRKAFKQHFGFLPKDYKK